MSVDDPLVSVDGLRTYYEESGFLPSEPVKAVDGVSFEVRRGETLGLVGESGCGKTTLGRTLVRLERSTAGRVEFDGTDVTALEGDALREWRERVAIVFQNPHSSLNERLTVGEIVREPLDVHDWGKPGDRPDRVRSLLDRVGLQREHYYRYPHQFSGGQRQRVAIARALAAEPEFVVLDEPVSALDVSVQAKILNLLADLQEEIGLTYLFIAHDLSVVRHISDRVAVMYLGNVAEIGPTDLVFGSPEHPYTHALLSAIPGDAGPDEFTDRITLRGTPPSPVDPPSGCPFTDRCPMKIRPEGWEDLDPAVWEAIAEFGTVIEARESGVEARIRELKNRLGLATDRETASAVADRLFAEVDAPTAVESTVKRIAERFDAGDREGAREAFDGTFASVCDRSVPATTTHATDHRSHCHRHDDAYEDTNRFRREVLER